MAKRKVYYSYYQLINILQDCHRKELVSEVIFLALESWRHKTLSDYAFNAILIKAVEIINLYL